MSSELVRQIRDAVRDRRPITLYGTRYVPQPDPAPENTRVGDLDRCNAPLKLEQLRGGGVAIGCFRDGGREDTYSGVDGRVDLGRLLDIARDHRDTCQAGPIR